MKFKYLKKQMALLLASAMVLTAFGGALAFTASAAGNPVISTSGPNGEADMSPTRMTAQKKADWISQGYPEFEGLDLAADAASVTIHGNPRGTHGLDHPLNDPNNPSLPNNPAQTLVGKKFAVYKLFFAENAVAGESINYMWDPVYKEALQQAVGTKLGKSPADVTEYDVRLRLFGRADGNPV